MSRVDVLNVDEDIEEKERLVSYSSGVGMEEGRCDKRL